MLNVHKILFPTDFSECAEHAFAEAARTRTLLTSPDGESVWFLSPEALAVFKLLFFRPKDLVDLERLIAVQGAGLDRAYVRRWIVDMMDESDARVAAWDDLVLRF
jgi:hypothetical protein